MKLSSLRAPLMMLAMLFAFAGSFAAKAQQLQGRTVTVTVTDNQGPVPGANVRVVDKTIGGSTDADGTIVLTRVPAGSVVEVSFVGYVTKKVSIGNKAKINIYLEEDKQKIDEAVVVAYGHQKKITVTGAIETVTNEELIETQVPNFANALAGRVAGLTTIQDSGQPGADDVRVYLRGQGTSSDNTPLLLIDGVPSDGKADKLGMLNVKEVASVTILKDAASTAIFGSRGANGVILITTRRGEAGKTVLDIQFTSSVASLHFPWTRVNSWEHAKLRNQARANDGQGPEFTDYQIAKFRQQSGDPFFPNRNMYQEAIAKFAPTERFDVNISGGSKKTRYFTNANIIYQEGNTKILPRKTLGYNAQFNMLRYTIRNNFDFNLNERLKISLNLSIYYQRTNQPSGGTGVFVTALETIPTTPGPLTVAGYMDSEGNEVPAGVVVFNSSGRSAWATVNRSGYYCNTNFSLISLAQVEYDMSKLLKGLSVSASVAYNDFAGGALSGSLQGFDAYRAYQAKTPGEKSYYITAIRNSNETFKISERQTYGNQMLQVHLRGNYYQQFGQHSVSAMVFAQAETKMSNVMNKLNAVRTSLPYKYAGISGRVTWDYKQKYMAEFDAGYNGSEQFAPHRRFGFFPAFSAGWVLSNEDFFKKSIPWIDTFKFRASIGKVGNANLGGERFLYYSTINKGDAGASGSLNQGEGVAVAYLGNPDVSWENVLKQNYAIDFAFLKNFNGKVDVFFEDCKNRLYMPASMPAASGIISTSIPRQNIGVTTNKGFEVELNWGKEFSRKFRMSAGGQFSYARAKIIYCDEVELDDTYFYRKRVEGFMPGQLWGLAIDYDNTENHNGYINTQEALDRAIEMYEIGSTPRLGDFQYKDANGDDIIDDRDLVPIKNSSIPNITFGFNVSFQYKRIGVSAQFNGMGQVSAYRMGLGVSELGSSGAYTDYHLRAWTKERFANGDPIDYPALSTHGNASLRANDFFINNRAYLRLKNLQISYSIPKNKLFRALGVASGNIIAYGNNVFIIDAQRVRAVDAETSGTSISYPLNRTYQIALDIKF